MLVIPADTVRRYEAASRPWLRGDYVHSAFAGLRGRRVLDLRCGDGSSAVLLAMRGAIVTGIDPSTDAVLTARRRAVANGVADRVSFEVASLAVALEQLPPASYDVIHGTLTLHRVREELETLLPAFVRLGRPGATLIFVEPVSLWRWRRELRQWLRPLPPGARPLDAADVSSLRRLLPRLDVRYFGLFAMVLQRAGFAPVYEKSSALERLTYDAAGLIDQFLFRVLRLRGLASSAVFVATLPSA